MKVSTLRQLLEGADPDLYIELPVHLDLTKAARSFIPVFSHAVKAADEITLPV